MQDYPIPLLGGDLLRKLHAQVTFSPEKQQLRIEVPLAHSLQLQALLTFPERPGGELFSSEISEQVDQTLWADRTPGTEVNMKPIKVNLKEGAWILYKQKKGYEVLPHKAQICKQEVAYLGFFPKQGTRSWMANRK